MDNNLKEENMTGEPVVKEEKQKTTFSETDESLKKYSGGIILALFIILALIMGGLYYWYTISTGPLVIDMTPARPTLETNKEPETPTATAQVESFTVMSTSDELTTIEADLESTNLDSLEAELNQIDAELEASLQ